MSETYDPLSPFTDEYIWGTPITDFVSSKRANWVPLDPEIIDFLRTSSIQSINTDVVTAFMTVVGMGRYNGRRNKNGESILELLRCKVHSKLLKMLPHALGENCSAGSTTSRAAYSGSPTQRIHYQGIRNGTSTGSAPTTRNMVSFDNVFSNHTVSSDRNLPSIDSTPSTLRESISSGESNSGASSVSSPPSESSNPRQYPNPAYISQDPITLGSLQEMMTRYKEETLSLLANDLPGLVKVWNSQNVVQTVREEVRGDLRLLATTVNDNLKHLLIEKARFQACIEEQSEQLDLVQRQNRELLRQNAEIKCENIELKRQRVELDQSAGACAYGSGEIGDGALDSAQRSVSDDQVPRQEQLSTRASPTDGSTPTTPRARVTPQLPPKSPLNVTSLRRALRPMDTPSLHPSPHSRRTFPPIYTGQTVDSEDSFITTPAHTRAQISPLLVPESVHPILSGLNEQRLKAILNKYAGDGITPEHISMDVREALGMFLEGDNERKQCQEKIDRAVGLFKDARVYLNEVWEALQAVGEFMKDRSQVGRSEVEAAGGRWDEIMNARGFL